MTHRWEFSCIRTIPWLADEVGSDAMHWPIFFSLTPLTPFNECVNISAHCKPKRCGCFGSKHRLKTARKELHAIASLSRTFLFISSVNFSTFITIDYWEALFAGSAFRHAIECIMNDWGRMFTNTWAPPPYIVAQSRSASLFPLHAKEHFA